jgi:uncharacterized membrane protein YdcZ (DUF606 family)
VSSTALAALLAFAAVATIIDRLGWFGVERIAVSWTRVLGLAFLCAGAVLTLRR